MESEGHTHTKTPKENAPISDEDIDNMKQFTNSSANNEETRVSQIVEFISLKLAHPEEEIGLVPVWGAVDQP